MGLAASQKLPESHLETFSPLPSGAEDSRLLGAASHKPDRELRAHGSTCQPRLVVGRIHTILPPGRGLHTHVYSRSRSCSGIKQASAVSRGGILLETQRPCQPWWVPCTGVSVPHYPTVPPACVGSCSDLHQQPFHPHSPRTSWQAPALCPRLLQRPPSSSVRVLATLQLSIKDTKSLCLKSFTRCPDSRLPG